MKSYFFLSLSLVIALFGHVHCSELANETSGENTNDTVDFVSGEVENEFKEMVKNQSKVDTETDRKFHKLFRIIETKLYYLNKLSDDDKDSVDKQRVQMMHAIVGRCKQIVFKREEKIKEKVNETMEKIEENFEELEKAALANLTQANLTVPTENPGSGDPTTTTEASEEMRDECIGPMFDICSNIIDDHWGTEKQERALEVEKQFGALEKLARKAKIMRQEIEEIAVEELEEEVEEEVEEELEERKEKLRLASINKLRTNKTEVEHEVPSKNATKPKKNVDDKVSKIIADKIQSAVAEQLSDTVEAEVSEHVDKVSDDVSKKVVAVAKNASKKIAEVKADVKEKIDKLDDVISDQVEEISGDNSEPSDEESDSDGEEKAEEVELDEDASLTNETNANGTTNQ